MIIYVVFCSVNGHVYKLAEAVAEGARSVAGASVKVFQTAELRTEGDLDKSAVDNSQKSFTHIPVIAPRELAGADAIIFGTPTKLGMMAAQMRNLLDQTGPLWDDEALIGKVGSVFTSATTCQGGQESTLTSFHATLLHLGMIIVGAPYCEKRCHSDEPISGRNPYGASMIVGSNGARRPDDSEASIARFQGQHVAEITGALVRGKALTAGRP